MVSRRIAAALAAFALCVGAPAAHAQVYLLNDNFNTENGGVGQLNYTGFDNWNVSGAVDLIGNGFFDFYPGNGLYVDMNGSPGPGTMTSRPHTTSCRAMSTRCPLIWQDPRADLRTLWMSLLAAFTATHSRI